MHQLGILFDIDDLGGDWYGRRAWDILLTALSPEHLQGCWFSHGDTDERIPGRRRPYCWAVALDCATTDQTQYVSEAALESGASGSVIGCFSFEQNPALMQQSLTTVGRIDERGHFVLLDGDCLWLLIAADGAGWKHQIENSCLNWVIDCFLGRYERGIPYGPETNLVLARSLAATGGSSVTEAIETALRHEKAPEVRQAYETVLRRARTPAAACAVCGTTLEERVAWWLAPPPADTVRLRPGDLTGLFLHCERCQKLICGGCATDRGQACGCPLCGEEVRELGHMEIEEMLRRDRL